MENNKRNLIVGLLMLMLVTGAIVIIVSIVNPYGFFGLYCAYLALVLACSGLLLYIRIKYPMEKTDSKGKKSMKNSGIATFLGSCVIGISIIVAGYLISEELPETTQVPGYISVDLEDQGEQFDNYMYKSDVARYLCVYEDDIEELLSSGELEGTYFVVGDSYIFIRDKIDEWVENIAIKSRFDNE